MKRAALVVILLLLPTIVVLAGGGAWILNFEGGGPAYTLVWGGLQGWGGLRGNVVSGQWVAEQNSYAAIRLDVQVDCDPGVLIRVTSDTMYSGNYIPGGYQFFTIYYYDGGTLLAYATRDQGHNPGVWYEDYAWEYTPTSHVSTLRFVSSSWAGGSEHAYWDDIRIDCGAAQPSSTPTQTLTPTLTATSTLYSAVLFPTSDIRPLCTPVPTGTQVTPSATFNGVWPTSIWAATNAVALLSSVTADPSRTPGTATPVPPWFETPTPSWTPSLVPVGTATRVPGDCRVPVNIQDVDPVVDIGLGYVLDENGNAVENCYTVIPYIHIEMPQAVRDIVNTLTGQETITVENSTFHIDDTEICVKYRTISGNILGLTLDSVVGVLVAVELVVWMLGTVRREM